MTIPASPLLDRRRVETRGAGQKLRRRSIKHHRTTSRARADRWEPHQNVAHGSASRSFDAFTVADHQVHELEPLRAALVRRIGPHP
jgi:hypothetical protein